MTRDQLAAYVSVKEALEQKECEESYYKFFKRAWREVEPETKLVDNWHIKYLCDRIQIEIERIGKKQLKTADLIVNVPPRSLKSMIFTIVLVPWAWIKYPHIKFINVSYSNGLSIDHCVVSRRLIRSEWYQSYWGDVFRLTTDQNVKSHFVNNKGGSRYATSITGSVTGHGGDFIGIDDPLDPNSAASEAERKAANNFVEKTVASRLNDAKVGLKLIIMQRLHEDDPTGRALTYRKEKHFHICLPALRSDDISPKELDKHYGESGIMFPKRFDMAFLDDQRDVLGQYDFAGQYQQRPSPAEGGMFKRVWWRFWQPAGVHLPPPQIKVPDGIHTPIVVDLPDKFDDKINSWDMSFKNTDGSDHVVGQVWGKLGPDKFLIDQRRDRMDFPQTVSAVINLKKEHPDTTGIFIEDKANGPAVISQLQREVEGLIPVKADVSKQARATPASRQAMAGNLYLPHPALAKWVDPFIDRCAAFPNTSVDDEIDAMAHGVNSLSTLKSRVWPMYNRNLEEHHRDFKPDFSIVRKGGGELITAIHMEDNLSISGVCCLWDNREKLLYIYNEIIVASAVPELLLPELRKKAPGAKVFGSKKMFNMGKDSVAPILRRLKINIRENYKYDEQGAIMEANKMFTKSQIIVHINAVRTNEQFSSWIIKDHKPEKHNIACCLALCNITSFLKEHKKIEGSVPFKPYSKKRQELRDFLKKGRKPMGNQKQESDWMA